MTTLAQIRQQLAEEGHELTLEETAQLIELTKDIVRISKEPAMTIVEACDHIKQEIGGNA